MGDPANRGCGNVFEFACRCRQFIAARKAMIGLAVLIPVALGLGLLGLTAFFWAMRKGQFEDLEGAAQRILIDDDEKEQ
tara:strand:- start:264 stop:500 length:237 start_codon:yes stop_codon:yes gene_type:complete